MSDIIAVSPSRIELRRLIWPAALCVWCSIALAASVVKPYHNWDTIGYAAAIYSWRYDDPAAVHRATYGDVRAVTPAAEMALLESENAYRRTVAADPAALQQQVPHYSIRPLYLLTGWALSLATGNVTIALRWISALSMFAAALLMYHAFGRRIGPRLAAVIVGLLAVSPYFLELSRLNTADAPTVLVTVLAAMLVLENRLIAGAAVVLAGTLVRTDLAVFAAALVGGLIVVGAWNRSLPRDHVIAIVVLVAAAVLSRIVEHLAGNYGLATLHHHEFIERLPYPAAGDYSLDPRFMIATSLHYAWRAVVAGFLWFPLALLAIGWYAVLTTRRQPLEWALLLGLTGALAARVALYPLLEVRFLTPTVVAAVCLLVYMAADRRARGAKSDSPGSVSATIIPA